MFNPSRLVAFGCARLGLSPRECWKLTYRELMPAIRAQSTGNEKVMRDTRSPKQQIEDFERQLAEKGIEV